MIVKKLPNPQINLLIHDMVETMVEAEGIGLAAPQVHISKQLLIFRAPQEDKKLKNNKIEITVLINPKLTKISNDTDNQWEGCLSIPGMTGLVKRYKEIRYEGLDPNGNKIQKNVSGLHARIVQHEYDHLMGILYTSRLADKRAFGFSEEIEKYWKEQNE